MAKKLTFAEQIKHPNWQKRRLEIMEKAEFSCENCGTKDVTLNVHHKRYVKGRMYWDYEDSELECLCEICHSEHHDTRALLDEVLSQAQSPDSTGLALGLTAGYFAAAGSIPEDIAKKARECARPVIFDLGVLAYALALAYEDRVKEVVHLLVADPENGWTARNAFERLSELMEPQGKE